jgi:hypothetical protein
MASHVLSLFLPDMEDDPDMSLAELDKAIQQDWIRQRTVEQWLKGDLPYEAVLDMVADMGEDAYVYDDIIADIVDQAIASGEPIDDADLILDTPQLILPGDYGWTSV